MHGAERSVHPRVAGRERNVAGRAGRTEREKIIRTKEPFRLDRMIVNDYVKTHGSNRTVQRKDRAFRT
jgi:hypothetical protein